MEFFRFPTFHPSIFKLSDRTVSYHPGSALAFPDYTLRLGRKVNAVQLMETKPTNMESEQQGLSGPSVGAIPV